MNANELCRAAVAWTDYLSRMIPHYAELDAQLSVGSCPADAAISFLASRGVRGLVSLQSDEDLVARKIDWADRVALCAREGITATRVPVVDFDRRDLARHLDHGVAAIAASVAAGHPTYVHCNAGINRSPSSVIGFLVAHRGLTLEAASAWVADRHDCYPYPDVMQAWATRHGFRLE
jgi:protein-tyrosine phosphatase